MASEDSSPKKPGRSGTTGLPHRVAALESFVAELRAKTRDRWDKAQVVSSFLVPVAIAFAGLVFSQSSKQAEMRIADTHARVAQAQLVHSFSEALVSAEPEKRKIAIEAVLLALPEDGTRLVETVKEFDSDASVRAFATQRLGLGATDLYAKVVFWFNNYEDPQGLPPSAIFADHAELEILLRARGEAEDDVARWSSRPVMREPETALSTRRQTVDREEQATVDGVTAVQTHVFDRFEGELGRFADPGLWAGAEIEVIFRAHAFDEWLRGRRVAGLREDRKDWFDSFYSVSREVRELWDGSDFEVVPILSGRIEVILGSEQVFRGRGVVAYVSEYDEDVRNLHVARFVRD